MNQPTVRLTHRLLSYLVCALLAGQPLLPAMAATLTPQGNTGTDKAANGVPVVNINTPNGAGISHNQFKDYNVGKEGLILNNATGKLNQTQLGGLINGNPNLKAGNEAKGIINEVTGGNRSQLQGYTEVAGKAANVMVANPYGITCNGCGFINTPNATLTTGKPVFDASGNLLALDVKKGSITIEGQGIDASGSDALSIISRATEVNAAIHAKDLKVIAGANRVGTDGSVQAQQGEGAAPTVAVDTGALGGMYANRIHLVSTEKGVGVNLGDLNARQGDITLDANGKLTVHNSLSSGALTANAQGIALTGDHKASGSMTLNSQGDMTLSNGSLTSDSDLRLTASGTLTHASVALTAGQDVTLNAANLAQDSNSKSTAARHLTAETSGSLTNQGQITAGQDLKVKANSVDQSGKLLAGNALQLNANRLGNSGYVQGKNLNVNSAWLDNGGSLLSGDTLTIATQDFTQSGSLGAKGKTNITADGSFNNSGSIVGDDMLTLNASSVTQNGILSGEKGLTVTAGSLTSGVNSVTHSNGAVALQTTHATLDGELSAGADLTLKGSQLTTAKNAQLQSGNNLSLNAQNISLAGTQAAKNALTLNASESLTHSGKTSASTLSVTAPELTNSGVLAANILSTNSQTLTNSGLLQGDSLLAIGAGELNNLQNGTLYSRADLTLTIPTLTNLGAIASDSALALEGQNIANSGKVIGSALSLRADTLSNGGLLQGANALTFTGNTFNQSQAGRMLTAGDLTLNAGSLTTAGVVQGQNFQLHANDWNNTASVLSQNAFDATLANSLMNSGSLLSQGAMTLSGSAIANHGSLLSAGDLSLSGGALFNDGTLQGNTLSLAQQSIDNRGQAIGLAGLSLTSSGALSNSGDLLTQGNLALKAGDISNSGKLQGESLQLDGSSLTNGGAIQSALDLALTLSGDMQAVAGSKITALGDARISGRALNNQGLVSASSLTLNGNSLNNAGEISGVNELTLALNGNLQQQGKLLSGGKLAVEAKEITNGGQLQGGDTQINASALTNSGRLQGDNGLTLNLLSALTNQASGVILSQKALSVTAPILTNDGTIQGNGTTTLNAAQQARNNGKILANGDLTLATPDYSGAGWLQATNLVLNVARLANGGTVMAANQATYTGNTLTNTGLLQAAALGLNTQTLTNSGTLLGSNSLNAKASDIDNSNGKVFSGGDLLLEASSLTGAGQLVALGNLTLKLVNGWTSQGVVAANKQLTVTSQGDITNASTLQADGITLTAAGRLINNGQLTAGRGATTLSGSSIAMNSRGALQAGGDVSLNSQGDIALDGFNGTAGSLMLTASGSIINTALLYAGNNLSLFANSIQNLRGDMLAGNNLVMQRDASGAANAEVINSSGSIETTRGDISIKTGNLLNTREGLSTQTTQIDGAKSISGLGDAKINVDISQLADGSYGMNSFETVDQVGPCNGHGACNYVHKNVFYYAMFTDTAEQKFINSQTRTDVTSTGGAARISSGKDLILSAGTLDNQASNILANGNVSLTGNVLNNQSWQSGTVTDWYVYEFDKGFNGYAVKPGNPYPTDGNGHADIKPKSTTIAFKLTGHDTSEALGEIYRSVIQAGGNVIANFASNISNTNTTANAGQISNTIVAPNLNTPSTQNIDGGSSQKALDGAGSLSITDPSWQNAGIGNQPIGDGSTLAPGGIDGNYPLPSGNNGYFVPSTDPDSPYLITVNPKLDGLGQLDPNLFGDLYTLMGMKPGKAPQETGGQYTDINQFLGSSYMLDRLSLNPDKDYRFLGDAAFDTRYVSNYVLNQTGSRYINGLGSDLDQMRYLMDSAADAQSSLGLKFGVALTADQIAALDRSILWWESATINGQSVMVPKVYLSPKDVSVQNGSVISGNSVQLAGGSVTNSGSSLLAQNGLSIDSSNSISNLNAGLISTGGGLNLSALGDINNIGSSISGNTVQLESIGGSINNITRAEDWSLSSQTRRGSVALSGTDVGQTASITATDGLSMAAGKDINITGANVTAGGDLALGAGNNINIAANQVSESSGQSGFWGKKASGSSSVTNQGSALNAGGNLLMQAGNDVNVTASSLNAGQTAQVVAGNDINLNAGHNGQNSHSGSSETHSSGVDRTTVSAGENVTLVAGRDITSQAAGIAAENNVGMQAGRDVNLLAEATADGSSTREKKKTVINESVRQQGTEITSGGNTTIIAGRDVTAEAAQVAAQGDIGVAAGRDVNLTTATESDYAYKEETKTKKGFLSKKTTHTIQEDSATREAGTLLSGDNVQVLAGNNLLVKGSSVVADDAVKLKAGNNVDIVAATNTDTSWRFKEEKKSGLMGTGGIGITVGSSKTTHDLRESGTTQSQSFSTVGSTGGSVDISAGNLAHIGGADLIAGKDLSLSGSSVLIEPGHDKRSRDETFEQKKSGLTLALSGAVGGAINNAVSSAQDTKEESDGRLKALQATKTVLSGVQAGQAAALDAASSGNTENPSTNAIGISASLTTQKSKSEQHAQSDAVTGSTLSAGNNLSITANGKKDDGNIVIAGSQLKAGGDTVLDAQNDILLAGAANTQQTTGTNSSSGGGVGIGIGVGSGGWGISVFANGNSAHGKDKGNGTDWTETTIDSGKTLTINSGRDTVLNGAQVSGDTIIADVGRDLLMSSQQDSNKYDSKQTSVAAGGSFTFGSMSGSGYINASQDKMKSRFDSVAEQTGMFAGNGGFDITVGNHTQLDGAVIASTASADKNSLDTGTLGFSDIHNEADFKTEHAGGAFNTGGNIAGQFASNAANALLAGGGNKGHAEGTTQAAVADGTITIRDKDNQKQDVADLSRDTENANDSISPIFDKEKEQKRLQEIQLIGEVGSQAADVARTQGDLAGRKAAKDPASLEEARRQLVAEGKPADDAAVAQRAYNNTSSLYGTGGAVQRGLQAVTGALTALASGGNLAGALAGASAPELANIIGHRSGLNDQEALIAHAVLGGVVASLQGNSAAAGAAGAITGELTAKIIKDQLFPGKSNSDLSESDKQLISNLATLASGLAGNLASGNSAGTTTAAQAGKNAAENNSLAIPITPPPVAGSNTGDAVNDANKTIASALDKKLEEMKEALDKATQCTFGRACSADDAEQKEGPNAGKNLTDADKAEIGGTGSGTPGGWEPEDEENARNSEKYNITVEDLTSTSSKGNETAGRSKLFERTGGSNAANKEFDALSPSEIKDIPGGRVGKLPDGRTVIVRERSTDGRPTLEIQSGKNRIKFRYDE